VVDEADLQADEQLTMYHPSEVELSETTQRIIEAVQHLKPQRMVFDSLSELRLLAQSSLRYRRQILALKQFFGGRGCTVLLLDDRTAEGPDLQLQSIAHGVVSLEHRSPAYGCALRQLRVVKFRGSDYLSGLQDCRIGRGGMEVFPRLTAADHRSDFVPETVASGVAALDALLGGGVDRGTATLLMGPPGSGKSTVALQYAAAAARRGDHAVMFVFEESRGVLLRRAAGLGIEIDQGKGFGQIDICQIDTASVSPGEFAHHVQQAVERDDARVVVIDSLNGYLNAMPEDRFLTAQLHELLSYLNIHGVATFLVAAQAGVLGTPMRASIDASYLADTVVLLRSYEHAGRVRKAISVLKKRSGGHEESIRQLRFDAQGVHMSEPLAHLRGVLSGMPVEVGLDGKVPRDVPDRSQPA
jgi:circadian clock protein KaiC